MREKESIIHRKSCRFIFQSAYDFDERGQFICYLYFQLLSRVLTRHRYITRGLCHYNSLSVCFSSVEIPDCFFSDDDFAVPCLASRCLYCLCHNTLGFQSYPLSMSVG